MYNSQLQVSYISTDDHCDWMNIVSRRCDERSTLPAWARRIARWLRPRRPFGHSPLSGEAARYHHL